MTMRSFITFVMGGALGFAAGAGLMLVFFPFFFPPAQVNERVTQTPGLQELARIEFFEDASGQDAGHWGKGDAIVYRQDDKILLELQANFEVGPGPNFWLYANQVADVMDEDDFKSDQQRVKLAKIKSFTGSQVYEIDAEVLANAKAFTIWCESFNQYITSANL